MPSAPSLKPLIGLLTLCLTACVTSPAPADSHESDLLALRTGAEALLPERYVTARAEDVETTGDAWNLLLDNEDMNFLHNQDKRAAKEFIRQAVEYIRASRRPCSWWDRLWNLRECR